MPFLLIVLYVLASAAVAGAAALLSRPIGLRAFLLFLLLPVLFLLPAFAGDKTALPVDHAMSLPPWSGLGGGRAVHNPSLLDLALQIAPWTEAVRISWREGEIPHLNRWNGCGQPLAANGQSAAFSPFTLLGLALPLAAAFTLGAALKLFLSLTGTWLWLRELKISDLPALFGALSFTFSLSMTPWLYFPLSAVVCLWPWALLAIEMLGEAATARRAFWMLLAVFALWPLAGHLESVASIAAFGVLWLVARWALGALPSGPLIFGRIACAAAAAVGLSAFSLLPQALAILASNRFHLARRPFWEPIFSWAPHGPRWTDGIFTSIFPSSLGDSIGSPMIAGRIGSFFEMGLGYFGIVGWAAFLLVLRPGSPRRRAELALFVPILFGLGAAIGLWPFAEILGRLPGLRMMFPLRFLSWVALGGAAVAAFELDRLRKDLPEMRAAALFPAFTAAVLALLGYAAFLRFRDLHAKSGGLSAQRFALGLAVVCLAAFALPTLFSRRSFRSRPEGWPFAAIAALAGAELFHQGARLYRYASPSDLFPETPLIRFLRGQRPSRVLGEGTALFPGSNVFARLEEIRTHDAVERREYVEFLDAACGYDPRNYFKQIRDVNARVLDLLNVKYLVAAPGRSLPGEKWKLVYSAGDGTVFENRDVLPKVFPQPAPASPSSGGVRGTTVSDLVETSDSIRFRVFVPRGRGSALLATSFFDDGGWSARDGSGANLRTSRANGPFLALRVPEGEHALRLRYTAPGFRTGLAISGATLAALAMLAAIRRARSGRSTATPAHP